jgi:hypothetical protein
MRGDQLGRRWRIIRAIKASPNGLTVAEIATWEETGIRTINRTVEVPQVSGVSLHARGIQRANRWAFIDTFKFRIPPFLSRRAANLPGKKQFEFITYLAEHDPTFHAFN